MKRLILLAASLLLGSGLRAQVVLPQCQAPSICQSFGVPNLIMATGAAIRWADGSVSTTSTSGEVSPVGPAGGDLGGTYPNPIVANAHPETADFVTTEPNPSHLEGRVFYDRTQKALSYYNEEPAITMNLGQELWIQVLNQTGVTLTDGQAVRINGTSPGGVATVVLSQATSSATATVSGLVTHSIENNTTGYITAFGRIHDLNTAAFAAGSQLYLSSSVAGGFASSVPPPPAFVTIVATVLKSHAVEGIIIAQIGQPNVAEPVLVSSVSANQMSINSLTNVAVSTAIAVLRGGRPLSVYFTGEIENGTGASRNYTLTIKIDGVTVTNVYRNTVRSTDFETTSISAIDADGLSVGQHTVTGFIRSDGTAASQFVNARELVVKED